MSEQSQPQECFGKYVLLERLATGGMAEVWLGKAPSIGGINKFVAIKRILPQFSDSPEFIDMFKDEAKIAINLNHSNVVSIFEFGVERKQFFLVLEYVEGRNLRQILNKLKRSGHLLTIEQILYVVKEIAAGLDAAHRCLDSATGRPLNITHRDMSPQNIMISFEGEVKIIDFGIAKAESQLETTRAGTLKGKFGYMSPEQAEGLPVDLRTDIFSLGIVLWELIANDRLFVANNEVNTLRKIRDCQVPSLRKINPNISPELDRIVAKALARDRNLRYQTSAAFQKDLSRFLNRQYPDFSPHDFSQFIKTVFSSEILESRERIIDYSSASVGANVATTDDEKTAVTATVTSTAPPQNSGSPSISQSNSQSSFAPSLATPNPAPSNFVHNAQSPVDLDFRKVEVSRASTSSGNTVTKNFGRAPVRNSNTQSNFEPSRRAGTKTSVPIPSQSSNSYFGLFMFLLILGCGYLYTMRPDLLQEAYKEMTGQEVKIVSPLDSEKWLAQEWVQQAVTNISQRNGNKAIQREPAKAATLQKNVSVYSNPIGAQIFIDGVASGESTPATLKVPVKNFTLELKLTGHTAFKQQYETANFPSQVNANLLRASVGYIDIQVVPNTSDIYINGEKLTERPPIRKLAIPADQVVQVKAVNPLNNAKDLIEVTVAQDKIKKITLYPQIGDTNNRQPSNNP